MAELTTDLKFDLVSNAINDEVVPHAQYLQVEPPTPTSRAHAIAVGIALGRTLHQNGVSEKEELEIWGNLNSRHELRLPNEINGIITTAAREAIVASGFVYVNAFEIRGVTV